MNARTIRRAAERKAAKLARKAEHQNSPVTTAASPAQIAANQANAQLSHGPTSETGKQISSQNALKTGLTGRTVLLPTDDTTAYQSLLDKFTKKHAPANEEERELVQSVTDSTWRLQRIVQLEFAIYAKGAIELAEELAGPLKDLDPATRAQMIQVETHLKYEKSLRNLHTQEARLQRRLAKDKAELTTIQTDRLEREIARQQILAARAANAAKQTPQPEIGFVFSNPKTATEPTPETATAAPLSQPNLL